MATAKSIKRGKQQKNKVAVSKKSGINVTGFNWGSLFTGTKPQLIAAKLAKPEHFKIRKGDSSQRYWLPLDWDEKYKEAVFGPRLGLYADIPPRWDAEVSVGCGPDGGGLYNVSVSYNNDRDMAFRQRAEHALIALQAAVKMAARIAPVPVHEQLGFKVEPKGGDRA